MSEKETQNDINCIIDRSELTLCLGTQKIDDIVTLRKIEWRHSRLL